MTASTLTGEQLLTGFSKFISDFWESTTTSAGTTTTLIDTILGRYGNNLLIDRFIRRVLTEEVRRMVIPFTQSTGEATVLPAFATATTQGITYQIHKYDPVDKWRALDAARIAVIPWVFREVRDDTLTADGREDEFSIPDAVLWGPEVCYIETPLPLNADWNLLDDTEARGAAAGLWAATNVTVTTYARNEFDKIVPKHNDTALKLVTSGTWTYDLVAANMKDPLVAASFAGRDVEFALWVYSKSTTPALRILTDAGTLATGTAHQGKGWELLRVSGTVAAGNATTFTVRLFGTGTLNLFRENAFVAFGTVPSVFDEEHPTAIERDSTIQKVRLNGVPLRGRQLRFVGKAPLSAIGSTGQAAATMEVDERSAQILYAQAAEELFSAEILSQPAMRDVLARIATVKDKRKLYQREWKHRGPVGRLVSPYKD